MLEFFAQPVGLIAVFAVLTLAALLVRSAWESRSLIAYHARMLWHEWRAR